MSGRFPFADEATAIIRESLKTFSNIKLMQQKRKEAEQAKKILFGRTHIGDEKAPFVVTKSTWIDPEMTGINDFNEKIQDSQALENITRKINEAGVPVRPIDWHEEHARFDQINKVLDYCTENNLSPEQLIEDHKLWRRFREHKAFKEQAKKDFGME